MNRSSAVACSFPRRRIVSRRRARRCPASSSPAFFAFCCKSRGRRIMPARPAWALPLGLLCLLATSGAAESGCAQLGRCCAGRSGACVSMGWRPDGSHGPCYCDQACPYTLDCCHDYRQVCPVPALITTGGYGKARKKRAVSIENEKAGYCVEFQLTAITEGCLQGNNAYTYWMKYLSEGHMVCVECQHPALDSRSLHCSGDGNGAKKNQLLHWRAVGNPRCRGTWRRVRQVDTCSCPSVHSFLFI
ncbi:somatomedin-B and thrombospondin type-1 domain-containing protein-like isoform X2 [Rhineura floridana]|uniref:somatomedin-B and thrombospondin type-1 domain-containing protein-like isoform X2 n=1 Tax=Rhineura floridana TaxID=261503 RepID=UPI002AC81049|nr:somatomedin-B and thrombospondin type-1 domain-containing protein-like isoform X2 [Rhineura floridana]